jgi:lipoate-protein ligase A
MSSPRIPARLLWSTPQPGAINMAIDEAMLECAARFGRPTLRFYDWSEPTLSLGYFQEASEIPPELAALPSVRRMTGGGAIVHHREITYSLVVPAEPRIGWPPRRWVTTVHEAAAAALTRAFPDLPEVRKHGVEVRKSAAEPFLCFERRSADDLVCAGCKLLGSAQRKRKGGLLQHGTLLLGHANAVPQLPGVWDLAADRTTIPEGTARLVEALLQEFTARLPFDFRVGKLTEDERALGPELEAKHRSAAWLYARRNPTEGILDG